MVGNCLQLTKSRHDNIRSERTVSRATENGHIVGLIKHIDAQKNINITVRVSACVNVDHLGGVQNVDCNWDKRLLIDISGCQRNSVVPSRAQELKLAEGRMTAITHNAHHFSCVLSVKSWFKDI